MFYSIYFVLHYHIPKRYVRFFFYIFLCLNINCLLLKVNGSGVVPLSYSVHDVFTVSSKWESFFFKNRDQLFDSAEITGAAQFFSFLRKNHPADFLETFVVFSGCIQV